MGYKSLQGQNRVCSCDMTNHSNPSLGEYVDSIYRKGQFRLRAIEINAALRCERRLPIL